MWFRKIITHLYCVFFINPIAITPSPPLIVPSPALITPSPGILAFTPLLVNKCSNKLAPNVLNYMSGNPSCCSFGSFLNASLTSFINKPYSLRGLIFFITYTFSFKNINVATPDQKTFFWIAASVAEAAAVNSNGIKTLF